MNKKLLAPFLWLILFTVLSTKSVMAAPHLTLTPSSKTVGNGDEFTVMVGVDSGTDTSTAVDAWGTFDATRLEIISIVKADNPAFPFTASPNIYNDTGKFDFSCASTDMSSFEDKVINGDLMKITFKAKATGLATVTFTCQSGSTIDSNIIKTTGEDIIDCGANQSGSYTIEASIGGDEDTTDDTTTTTTSSSELPQTGGFETTMIMLVLGTLRIAGSLFFKKI